MDNSVSQAAPFGPGSPVRWLSHLIRTAFGSLSLNRSWGLPMRGGVLGTAESQNSRDLRGATRRRTYLRSGKVAYLNGRIIAECQIRDLSVTGAKLRVAKTTAHLPRQIRLFDDTRLSIETAEIIWRRDRELGIRFLPDLDDKLKQTYRTSREGKVYSVKR
jgi:hypothetical protein